MSQTAQLELDQDVQNAVAIADATLDRGFAAILQPGQSATVYVGAENETFRISLIGTIQREASLTITVDNQTAATLTFDARSTIVNGRSISVSNSGRVAQGFTASLIP